MDLALGERAIGPETTAMLAYRESYERHLGALLESECDRENPGIGLSPGCLVALEPPIDGVPMHTFVADGDTLCCACSAANAARDLCHRAWAAPYLVRAGWRVLLDGVEVTDAGA